MTIGADDYVTKPFNPLELVARVKAQLRRSTRYNAGAAPESHVIDFSGLEINKDTHECRLYDQPVDLTPTEFSLLWMLCQNRGRCYPRRSSLKASGGEVPGLNNTVMVHIRRLREKLHEPARNPKFIKTVWGWGTKLRDKYTRLKIKMVLELAGSPF
ncbi:MAG: response regulator transcription factor [Anaeromassilibacillus sp.]